MSQRDPENLWQRYVVSPIRVQLTQGVTPKHLALSCALGVTIGVFPIIGSTTLICLIVAAALKLNQPAIQAVNYVVYPLQILLVPVFVRSGEYIFQAEPVSFSPTQLVREFGQNPGAFLSKYGMAGFHGVTAWCLFAPIIAFVLYKALHPIFRNLVKTEKMT
jgi:uncharacterized protein (DUF2062 family)